MRREGSRVKSGGFCRAHLVPVPEVSSLGELNDRIGGWCIEDLGRTIRGRRVTVGEALGQEIELLRALPAEAFRRLRARPAQSGLEVAGGGSSEPVLGAGEPGRAAGRRPARCTRDHLLARWSGGRAPRAAAGPVRHLRAGGSLLGAACAQARRARPVTGASPAAGAAPAPPAP